MRDSIFTIRAFNKKRKEWDGWTGEFQNGEDAEAHTKIKFSTPYYMNQYDFGLFVKDSDSPMRKLKMIEMSC